jgi:uncharacterized membrane protein
MRAWEVYAGAALLGTVAGMRSMAAPAILGRLSSKGALDGITGPLAFVGKPLFSPAMSFLTVGEMIVDKLPIAPNRTEVGPLLGRALTGALSGAVVCAAKKRPAWAGALIGAAAAVGATYGAYQLRKRAGSKLHLPDMLIALTEDAVVGSLGVAITSRLSAPSLE